MSGERKIDRPFCERVDPVEARAEVDRLLSDPLFQSPERNKNFLRFIATEYFEGRADTIKAYAVAVDVFGRPPSFDPSTDPIVRIEATRLRASLSQYYDAHGSETGIRVDLPRGRYVPVFSRTAPDDNDRSSTQEDEGEPDEIASLPRAQGQSRRRFWPAATVFSAACALIACGVSGYALAVGLGSWQHGVFTHKPLVSITMTVDDDTPPREAEKVRDYLMVAISQFQTVRLQGPDARPLAASVTQWPGLTLASSRRGQRTEKDYQIALKYETDGSARFVWWQVNDASTGETLQSGIQRAPLVESTGLSPYWSLANDVARTLAGTRGVINTVETSRDLLAPSLGNGCVLRAIAAVGQRDAQNIMDARACLERTLAAAPNDAGVKTELAIVLMAMDAAATPSDLSSRAGKLASDAVLLAPFSDRSRYALMISQFRAGHTRAAIDTGYAAMALNPNNTDIVARLGLYLMMDGRWEEGAGLASRSAAMSGDGMSDVLLTRALNAYRLGRFEDALLLAQQMGREEDFVANAVQAAAAGQLGRAQDARTALTSLGAGRSDFETSFRNGMAARHVGAEMIGLLEAGMLKAAAQSS